MSDIVCSILVVLLGSVFMAASGGYLVTFAFGLIMALWGITALVLSVRDYRRQLRGALRA